MAKTTKRTSKKPVKRASKPKKRSSKKASSKKRTSRKPAVWHVGPVTAEAKASAAKTAVDFDDEDSVREEMARALGDKPDDLTIKETSAPAGVGDSKVYLVEYAGGGPHGKEYYVVENDDAAEELALASVTHDLEENPEYFNQSFIESHIDEERLRRDLYSDTLSSTEERLREERPSDFWREAARYGVSPKFVATGNDPNGNDHNIGEFEDDDDATEAGEKWVEDRKASDPENANAYHSDVEQADPSDSDVESVAEAQTNEQLKDPMSYLEDIYGKEDAVKQAIQIAGIDVKAAAQEAVNTDGAGHFLSSYDGKTHETPNGLVYWRHN